MNVSVTKLALLTGACVLSACAPVNPPLYYWGNYQPALYQYHQDGVTDYAGQISAMETVVERANAEGKSVPPGIHAHLGMLYFNTGREIEAHEQFAMERQLFPESGHFVNYVVKAQPEVSQ